MRNRTHLNQHCLIVCVAICTFLLFLPLGSAHAKGSYDVLHIFRLGRNGDAPAGGGPSGGLIADTAGDLYSTTNEGGKYPSNCPGGCGAVFKLAPDGALTALHTFTGGSDGGKSSASLIADSTDNLYGTAAVGGGDTGCANGYGCGTVFKLAPDGTLSVLHAFTDGSDGGNPEASLIADKKGNLYGTTYEGTIFEVTPDGTEKVLYTFKGGNDGAYPYAGLIMDGAGNLYGTTQFGGYQNPNCSFGINPKFGQKPGGGCGTVFKLAPDGTETVLYAFTGSSDGGVPYSSLIIDKKGNLYGTTFQGGNTTTCGAPYGCGTVFKVTSNGAETVLHAFNFGDGELPTAGLTADKQGNLYGTTYEGGAYNGGNVFKLAPDGTLTVLLNLSDGRIGANPYDVPLRDSAGNLFGTTTSGAQGFGTVFEIPVQ